MMLIPEVAAKLGVSIPTVRNLIKSGKLKAQKAANTSTAPWLIQETDLNEFIAMLAKPKPVEKVEAAINEPIASEQVIGNTNSACTSIPACYPVPTITVPDAPASEPINL